MALKSITITKNPSGAIDISHETEDGGGTVDLMELMMWFQAGLMFLQHTVNNKSYIIPAKGPLPRIH